mmetsp:Transcript_24298/g.52279  ORF Transcript_24298/g.52279 Transcript_24298/m.52279 type:complete len:202 (-) Transcript_24298:435-1040(-)
MHSPRGGVAQPAQPPFRVFWRSTSPKRCLARPSSVRFRSNLHDRRLGPTLEDLHPLHLVEHRVVRRVNGVPSVHVADHKEVLVLLPQQLRLVRARVAPKHLLRVHVVRVVLRAGDVVLWDEELVKVLRGGHDWVEVVEQLERALALGLLKVLEDGLLDDPKRVVLAVVEVHAQLLEDGVRHVVLRVAARFRGRLRVGAEGR